MAATAISLTETQRKVLAWVKAFISKRGFAPSFREISDGCCLGHQYEARRAVTAIADAGYWTVTPNVARSIVLRKAKPKKNGAA